MRLSAIIAPALILASAVGGANAQDTGHFTLERSGDGYVRMDNTTGEMSLCEEQSGQLVCRIAADERAAFQDDIDRLETALKELDARVAKLENTPTARLNDALPSNEQIDRSVETMSRFLRGFMGVVKELENEAEGQPDKTSDQKT